MPTETKKFYGNPYGEDDAPGDNIAPVAVAQYAKANGLPVPAEFQELVNDGIMTPDQINNVISEEEKYKGASLKDLFPNKAPEPIDEEKMNASRTLSNIGEGLKVLTQMFASGAGARVPKMESQSPIDYQMSKEDELRKIYQAQVESYENAERNSIMQDWVNKAKESQGDMERLRNDAIRYAERKDRLTQQEIRNEQTKRSLDLEEERLNKSKEDGEKPKTPSTKAEVITPDQKTWAMKAFNKIVDSDIESLKKYGITKEVYVDVPNPDPLTAAVAPTIKQKRTVLNGSVSHELMTQIINELSGEKPPSSKGKKPVPGYTAVK
jgi:hypothetical protein